jgi:hypothetical protein
MQRSESWRVSAIARFPESHREDKFLALTDLTLNDNGWQDGETSLRGPFLPERGLGWGAYPALLDLFDWSTPGVKTHRTWVIAPDAASLSTRWDQLRAARDPKLKDDLFHPDRDRTLDRTVKVPLGHQPLRAVSVALDNGSVVPPVRYGFRSLDRQWIIPDHRLLSQARPDLWAMDGKAQIYLTALDSNEPGDGPALSFTGLIPDQHHFKGSFGGRAVPLWRDAAATVPNIKAALLAHLSTTYGKPVTAPDMMAYVAALLAHPPSRPASRKT